ncbi:tumor necrosis factor ligand superfamily member 9 [Ctenodactylus gundi]
MSQAPVAADSEAALPPTRPGARCPLPGALRAALLLLPVVFAGGVGTGIALARRDLLHPSHAAAVAGLHQPEPQEWGVAARLLPKDVSLRNGTLNWHSSQGAGNAFLSSGLKYDPHTRELVIDTPGFYYVVLQLKLRRALLTSQASGQVLLTLDLHSARQNTSAATIKVDLKPESCSPVEKVLIHRLQASAGQRLKARLSVHGELADHWELVQPSDSSPPLLELLRGLPQ